MNITVIGVGENLLDAEDAMKEMAGSKGRVLLYKDFSGLASHLDDLLTAVCGKLAF